MLQHFASTDRERKNLKWSAPVAGFCVANVTGPRRSGTPRIPVFTGNSFARSATGEPSYKVSTGVRVPVLQALLASLYKNGFCNEKNQAWLSMKYWLFNRDPVSWFMKYSSL